jgi:hypothetical protein
VGRAYGGKVSAGTRLNQTKESGFFSATENKKNKEDYVYNVTLARERKVSSREYYEICIVSSGHGFSGFRIPRFSKLRV